MHAFGESRSQPLRILIDQDIVNVIVGDMMFHPEDMNGVSRTRLLASSASTPHSSEKADAKKVSRYAINVSNAKHFLLIVQYLVGGLSFCRVNRVATMGSSKCEMLFRSIASAILALVDDINDVVAKKTADNESYFDAAPDILHHQLVRVLPRNFCSYLQLFRERLEQTFSADEIEKIKRQYKTLYGS